MSVGHGTQTCRSETERGQKEHTRGPIEGVSLGTGSQVGTGGWRALQFKTSHVCLFQTGTPATREASFRYTQNVIADISSHNLLLLFYLFRYRCVHSCLGKVLRWGIYIPPTALQAQCPTPQSSRHTWLSEGCTTHSSRRGGLPGRGLSPG